MKFVVIIEHLTMRAEIVGPFEHEEEARLWAQDNVHGSVWRVATMRAPK